MTVKTFFLGLAASFALPWLVVIAVPYAKMSSLEPIAYDEQADGKTGLYQHQTNGRIQNGSLVYGAEGCAMCHSQLARPSYAGNDVFRDGLGGLKADPNRGDTRRESNVWDYSGEKYAWIGESRMGPDLGNYGSRIEALVAQKNEDLAKAKGVKVDELSAAERVNPEILVMMHLYNPRLDPDKDWSTCPSNPHMFEKKKQLGQASSVSLPVEFTSCDDSCGADVELFPKSNARAITSYLLSLKRDNEVPYSINYRQGKKKASDK